MKDILIKNILHGMVGTLDSRELEILKEVLQRNLKQFAITENKAVDEQNKIENSRYLTMFISAKQVEGCSSKTLNYYQTTIEKLLSSTNKWIKDITTDDLREYLSAFQSKNNASKVTVDNVRRILSSFLLQKVLFAGYTELKRQNL